MNRKDLEKRVNKCAAQLVYEKGYVSPLDLMIKMERITSKPLRNGE